MNPNRYRQMGPPAGVCIQPSKVHAPAIRDPGPTLRADVRQLLDRHHAALQRDLDALLGVGQAQVTPAPVLLQDFDADAQTWSAGCRVHVLIPIPAKETR